MQNGVYLLLGSNLGNREENLFRARDYINNSYPILACSSIYQTQAWGNTEQPDYLNQVIQISCTNSPQVLLKQILCIENDMGRIRTIKWGARTIDIDILFYGQTIIHESNLIIPHPEIANRRFTLLPFAELANDFTHPILNKNCAQLLRECADQSIVNIHSTQHLKN